MYYVWNHLKQLDLNKTNVLIFATKREIAKENDNQTELANGNPGEAVENNV